MQIKIVKDLITKEEIRELAKEFYVNIIKGVCDVENEIVAFGGEYHMDANIVLIEHGSKQENIWGFNICLHKNDFLKNEIEYISLINIRPKQENFNMEIKSQEIRDKIKKILDKMIK